jgi:signal transduction histidine kinase
VIRGLHSFYARISTIFLLLVLALGAGIVAIAFNAAGNLFGDVEQLLNRDYARSIARQLAPAVSQGFDKEKVMDAIQSMMILNPRVEIYILDAEGKILGYFLNPHETVYLTHVELRPILAFIESGGMRLAEGRDPRSRTRSKRFSAAPLNMGGEKGFVYIILGGAQYDSSLRMIRSSYYIRAGVVAFALAVVSTLVVGLAAFFLLTRRLTSLGTVVRGFERGELTRRADARGADELGALGRAFNDMAITIAADVDKLRLAERMRSELIGNISHDLRSPLASIQGYLETTLRKDAELDPRERRRFLEISLRSAESLRRLVEELFDLVRLETRQIQPWRESFSIAELAQDVVLKLAPAVEKAGVTVSVRPARGVPPVFGDIGMIERVLTNLIENAVRFTPRAGTVRVDLREEGREVLVSVADTGPGIDPEDLPRIFERFYRADPSRDRSTQGAGLGLAIARQIVELHGSTLEVTSRPSEGAVFSFRLAVTESYSFRDTSVTSPG